MFYADMTADEAYERDQAVYDDEGTDYLNDYFGGE